MDDPRTSTYGPHLWRTSCKQPGRPADDLRLFTSPLPGKQDVPVPVTSRNPDGVKNRVRGDNGASRGDRESVARDWTEMKWRKSCDFRALVKVAFKAAPAGESCDA